MTDAYLRSRIDTLDGAYAKLDRHQRRKGFKVVRGPQVAHEDDDIASGASS